MEHIFNTTACGPAHEFYKSKTALWFNNLETNIQGVVFSDAETKDGQPLNNRQKNIIEAHEKGHGLRDYTSYIERQEFKGCIIDESLLNELCKEDNNNPKIRFKPNYLNKTEEISERMTRLKNYFGMKAEEVFTSIHLSYVREHYIEDTGLDNSMSTFFKIVTPQTEANFLKVINKYPVNKYIPL